jgi:hypothetical protein
MVIDRTEPASYTLWRPTVDNYFGRVTVSQLLIDAEELLDAVDRNNVHKLKKKDLAIRLEEACALGSKNERWLPAPMRTGSGQN